MTKPLRRRRGFFRRQVWPRREAIFLHRNVFISVLAASVVTLFTTFLGHGTGMAQISFREVATALLAFAGLSFGGCIMGASVAIALPSDRLLATMTLNGLSGDDGRRFEVREVGAGSLVVNRKDGSSPTKDDFSAEFRSHYKELVFTFIYSAVVQLMLAFLSVSILLLQGDEKLALAEGCSFPSRLSIFLLTLGFAYSLLQLFSSLQALMGVANLRDKYIRSELLK